MTEKPLTYAEYLKVPELLSLQRQRSSPPHHDETLFIIVHQAYELWFKQMLHEIDTTLVHLGAGRVGEAGRLLRRVVEVQRLLVEQIRVIETMRPQDFLGFRYHLNPASGFQSVQFRELEFVLGLKSEKVASALDCAGAERERLSRRLREPSLADAFDRLLIARGFPREPEPEPAPDGRSQPEEWRLAALVRLYSEPSGHDELLALAEILIEIDEWLSLWRTHHVHMVERMVGAKRGTGGSDGVAYLMSTLSGRAFPDLWRARTHLGDEPG